MAGYPQMNWAYRPTKSVTVYEKIGVTDSNTYVGSSRMLANVWRPLVLTPKDLLLDLCGGLYVLREGEAICRPATVEVSEKHPFEKTYGGVLRFHQTTKVASMGFVEVELPTDLEFHRDFRILKPEEIPAGAKTVGRNIDLLVP